MSVVVALPPLSVRGHGGGGVCSCDVLLALFSCSSHAGGGRGLLTAPALGAGALGVVPGQLARRETQEGVEGYLTASCGF